MAMTCPHCGVAVKGHLYECPECGEYVLDCHSECPECGAELEFANASGNTDVDGIDGEKPNKNGDDGKGKDRKTFWLTLLLLVLVCGLGGGYYLYDQYKANEEKEFLRMMEEKRLQELRNEEERVKAMKADSLDWRRAMKTGNEDAMRRYMSAHEKDGLFLDSAEQMLAMYERLKVTEQEKIAIRNVVEDRLAVLASTKVDVKDADVLGVHYQIEGPVDIKRVADDSGATVISVSCTVSQTLTRTDPTKPNSVMRSLKVIMDSSRNVLSFKM